MGKNPAKSQKEQSSYEIRDVVLAKVRGFPPWPGMIVDPDMAPPGVAKERPTSKKTTFYCVQFFPAGDYAWLVPKDISKLQIHEIESYISEPYKRSGDLLLGYRIALDPKKWEEEREVAGLEAGEEEANAEVDQLDSENEEGQEKKPVKSKKRKRDSDAPSASKSKSKSKSKKGSAEPVLRRKPSVKGKKNGTKSKTLVESEDEGDSGEPEPEDDDVGPSKKASPPPAKKTKRDKDPDEEVDPSLLNDVEAVKVREWRHKLQKTFLSLKSMPKEEDMPALDQLFTTVEQYDKINIQYLTFSKIGKVMRHIAVLPEEKVPRDDEFRFRERAKALVDRWHQILHENKPNGADANGMSRSDGGRENRDGVTDDTVAHVLNGKADGDPIADSHILDASASEPANEADVSILADVTMSEA